MGSATGSKDTVTYGDYLFAQRDFRNLAELAGGDKAHDHLLLFLEIQEQINVATASGAIQAIISDEVVLKKYATTLKDIEDLRKKFSN